MLPNTFKELCAIFNKSYALHIKFTKAIENDMTYPEENMIAVITKMAIHERIKDGQDETCLITCNYSEYREHNKPLESPTYYLKTSMTPNGFGTATQAGAYNNIDVLMIDATHDPNTYFTLLDNNLITIFLNSREGQETYVQWLERLVIKSKILKKLYVS